MNLVRKVIACLLKNAFNNIVSFMFKSAVFFILYSLLISVMCCTCFAHSVLLNLIVLIFVRSSYQVTFFIPSPLPLNFIYCPQYYVLKIFSRSSCNARNKFYIHSELKILCLMAQVLQKYQATVYDAQIEEMELCFKKKESFLQKYLCIRGIRVFNQVFYSYSFSLYDSNITKLGTADVVCPSHECYLCLIGLFLVWAKMSFDRYENRILKYAYSKFEYILSLLLDCACKVFCVSRNCVALRLMSFTYRPLSENEGTVILIEIISVLLHRILFDF